MEFFSLAVAMLAVVISVGVVTHGEAEGQAMENPEYLGLHSTDLNTTPCALAPCVIPPVWPSASVFTADAPIAANPRNPKQLLMGSVDQNCNDPGLGFYLSSDGGMNWQRRCMPIFSYKNNEYDPAGSPMVGFDTQGTIYEAGYALINNDFSSAAVVALQRSNDGGETWTYPMPVMGHADSVATFNWLTVDNNESSPYVNSVYVSGVVIGPINLNVDAEPYNRVVVSHSNDGGVTWKQVPVAPAQHPPYEDQFTTITVGRDGTVYMTWVVCTTESQACTFGKGDVMFSKSRDAGNIWSKPSLIATVNQTYPLPNTSDVRIYETPVIGVDNSGGPHAGSLYVASFSWTGNYLRLGVIRSTDGGNTWSEPVPVAPPSETHDQFFPWLSVSSSGLVGVSWMDRRNDPANTNYQAFAAISSDGGRSFGPNIQLTTGFSDPNRGGEGNGWIGDYTGNTWAGPNYFVAAWMDNSETPNMEDVVGGIRLK